MSNNHEATVTAGDTIATNGASSIHELFVHGTLRHEEYKRYDSKLVEVARQRLTIVEDLRAAGLVVPMSFGTTETAWERVSDLIEAEVNMDGRTATTKDRVTYDEESVPIPVFMQSWSLGMRQIEASRTTGNPLPTEIMSAAVQSVAHRIESAVCNGIAGFTFNGKQVHGLTTYPHRNTVTLAGSWTAAGGATIKADTINLLKAAYADNMHGPFNLYVANDIYANIQDDFSTEKGDRTHAERIMAFNDISAVKAADKLPSGNVVLVQMTDSVIDLAVGQDIANVQWNVDPMSTEYMVYAAMAPRIKSDREGRCGIVHGTV